MKKYTWVHNSDAPHAESELLIFDVTLSSLPQAIWQWMCCKWLPKENLGSTSNGNYSESVSIVCNALFLPVPGPTSGANPPVTIQLTSHLYLVEGAYEDIKWYAGTMAHWIIKVAHLLYDPLRQVHLGILSDWYHLDRLHPAGDKCSRVICYSLESMNSSQLASSCSWE